ncbi:MAG: Protease HtpX-like protein [Candidatus Nomurabacteria bacterium GW2011_GWC2_41_8]|uniref:Protease HtpX homolog n=3 Tax=Candidatus Nomuraibacteriota TaxID=1752729 RepID=A0A1F6YBI1_9BACT|nr:MAG: Protease HtpX-like protein [Candidatus Nomurabacteria bacterium GW2011_GWA2_41_25]KKS23227.1 MAG: Protease HtpX-like protein [Candidatus Nomurabacteria bacterium GW2011_GWC2_41_8]OGI80373.1 MAG: zinc metalloprotease HtpX [Candidatus Nomurabacteria bacterium RIFCSPHIGHO2_02_FULL_41_52]OGI85342.1 MAG: zinc metalloprotease HtpX [Candidatus Nomurabacteria bacterium RIFCSPHIGHO2_12_FULL_42_19]OGI93952.1 MAG: zinc metalloprotease HtpX [Candidatus Nomurabacteria bacterium RIFCSPLOWO2_01_FULL_4
MATLYTEQSKNVTKTWLLMSIFFIVVIGFGWFFSFYYGNPNILYFFVIFSILMNIFSYWFSDKIVLSLAGAKPANREENFNLYTSVENLSITAGLPMPRIYIINDSAPNAFATGRDKEHAVVAVTTGLLGILDKTELEGVIAHELSHIGNRDMLLSTVVVVLVGFISILADIFRRNLFFSRSRDNDNKMQGIMMLVGIILSILAPIIAILIQLAISRKREFLADVSGALLTRYPEGLAGALAKISKCQKPMVRQSGAIAHLYIADPKGVRLRQTIAVGEVPPKAGKISGFFATHPPVEERIKALIGG